MNTSITTSIKHCLRELMCVVKSEPELSLLVKLFDFISCRRAYDIRVRLRKNF